MDISSPCDKMEDVKTLDKPTCQPISTDEPMESNQSAGIDGEVDAGTDNVTMEPANELISADKTTSIKQDITDFSSDKNDNLEGQLKGNSTTDGAVTDLKDSANDITAQNVESDGTMQVTDSSDLSAQNSRLGNGHAVNDLREVELIQDCQVLADIDNSYRLRDPFLCSSSSESDSDSSSDESSSSDSSSSAAPTAPKGSPKGSGGSGAESGEDTKKNAGRTKQPGNRPKVEIAKTKGELFLEDLPPIADLNIEVDSSVEMVEIGKVAHIVGTLVVVQANPDTPALNMDSILFNEKREPLGQVFETFGRVSSPMYTVRFNSDEHLKEKNVETGLVIYCAPKMTEWTHFVFVEQLKKVKGSDASWENNNEPPDKYLDYSDDEGERRAKAKQRPGDKEDRGPGGKNKKIETWPPENDPNAPRGPSWQPGVKDIRNPWSGPSFRNQPPLRGPRPHNADSYRPSPPPPPRSPAPQIPFGRLPPPTHWTQRAAPPNWMARFQARPPGHFQVSVPMPPPNFGQPPPAVSGITTQAPGFSQALSNVAYNPVVWSPAPALTPPPNGQLSVSQASAGNLTPRPTHAANLLQPSALSFLHPYAAQPVSNSNQVVSSNGTPPLLANFVPTTQSNQSRASPQLQNPPVSYHQPVVSSSTGAITQSQSNPLARNLLNLPPPPAPPQNPVAAQNCSPTWVNGQAAVPVVDPRQIQAVQYAAVAGQNPAFVAQYSGHPYYQWQQ